MVEFAPSTDPGQHKRRSARIVQAVPVTVVGTDALGQAFQERTSTVVVNNHGCKYQSKHYVLKNRWVTLEVPHPQQDQEPRRVRARVISIQRPRTVRELFQIGAELEIPGNVWGIAFPPDDWFEFPDAEAAEPPARRPEPEPWPAMAGPAMGGEDRPHVVPSLEAPSREAEEAGAALSERMARLLAEARQQLAHAAREAAARAAETETRALLGDLTTQLQEAAGRAVESAAAGSLEEAIGRAVAQIQRAGQEQAAEMDQTIEQRMSTNLREAAEQFAALIEQACEEQRRSFAGRLDVESHEAVARLGEAEMRLAELRQSLEAARAAAAGELERLRSGIESASSSAQDRWRKQLNTLATEAMEHLSELEQATRDLDAAIAEATGAARSRWRGDIEADLAEVVRRWGGLVESSLDEAGERLSARLSEATRAALAGAERTLAGHAAEARTAVERAAAEAAETIAGSRAALEEALSNAQVWLTQIEARAADLERRSSEVAAKTERAAAEFQQRFESWAEGQRARLGEEIDRLVGAAQKRLEPGLAAAEKQALERFSGELEGRLTAFRVRADESLGRLQSARQEAEQAVEATGERLAAAADEAIAQAAERLRATLAQVEGEFAEAGRTALEERCTELENRGSEISHATTESLYKSSEWYQKKAQAAMQSALEKALEQAGAGLREQAADTSRRLASELDHYTRNFTENARDIVEEAARETLDRSRNEIAQAAAAASESLGDDARRVEEEHRRRLAEAAEAAFGSTASQLAARTEEVRAEVDAAATRAVSDFDQRLAEGMAEAVEQARQHIAAGLGPALETLSGARDSAQQRWQQDAERLAGESLEHFRQRLENVSNSWLVASATTLTERSRAALDELAAAAEERLRLAAAQAFGGLADSFRDRLATLAGELAVHAPAPPSPSKEGSAEPPKRTARSAKAHPGG